MGAKSSSIGFREANNSSSDSGEAGSMISLLPSLRIIASSPANSNSRGIRAARLRPFLNTFTRRSVTFFEGIGMCQKHMPNRVKSSGGLYEGFPKTLRSAPVISFGSSIPSIPRMVGEISRSDPFGVSVNRFESSANTIKGTGLVVCAVCGPPVTGSIIISALP